MVALFDDGQDTRDGHRNVDGTTSAWSAHGEGVIRLGCPVPEDRVYTEDERTPMSPYHCYTPEEDARLLELYEAGLRGQALDRALGRANQSTLARLRRLRRLGPTQSPTGPSTHGDSKHENRET